VRPLIGVRLGSAPLNCHPLLLFAAPAAPRPISRQDSAQHGDIEVAVSLDAGEQSGSASATVRIHARREVVWSLITSCAEALHLVPGLVDCDVMETAAGSVVADGSGT
jgi:hypothetical protein